MPRCIVLIINMFRCFKIFSPKKIPTWKETLPWCPPIKGGIVIKVYDGDTITIASKLPYRNSPMYRWSVRLNGIDTPEMKSKEPVLKEAAVKAKEALSNIILNKTVELRDVSIEKYGRVLATVIFDGKNLNQWLLDEKLAYEYSGATKFTELEQIEFLNLNPE